MTLMWWDSSWADETSHLTSLIVRWWDSSWADETSHLTSPGLRWWDISWAVTWLFSWKLQLLYIPEADNCYQCHPNFGQFVLWKWKWLTPLLDYWPHASRCKWMSVATAVLCPRSYLAMKDTTDSQGSTCNRHVLKLTLITQDVMKFSNWLSICLFGTMLEG